MLFQHGYTSTSRKSTSRMRAANTSANLYRARVGWVRICFSYGLLDFTSNQISVELSHVMFLLRPRPALCIEYPSNTPAFPSFSPADSSITIKPKLRRFGMATCT